MDNEYLSLSVTNTYDGRLNLSGQVKQGNVGIELLAANPIDRMASYTGSGLPFPCLDIALEGTVNRYIVDTPTFTTQFEFPNSFYDATWSKKIGPAIFAVVHLADGSQSVFKLDLEDPLPLKTLTHRPERSPEFYANREKMGVKDQFALLLELKDAKIKFPTA